MVFSLSKEKELLKTQERRGKARGRGRVNPSKVATPPVGGGAVTRYPAPKSGSGGITVIEPLDKDRSSPERADTEVTASPSSLTTVAKEQFEDAVSTNQTKGPADSQPGLPLRKGGDSEGGEGGVANIDQSSAAKEGISSNSPAPKGGVASQGEESPSAEVKGEQPNPQEGGVATKQDGTTTAAAAASSKPKRYSSQRQRTAAQSEHQGE